MSAVSAILADGIAPTLAFFGFGFGFRRHHGHGGGGGAGDDGLTPTFDNRYGTDTTTAASTGKFTFALKSGCTRTYVDSVNGNDTTGDGTLNNPYRSVDKAWPIFISGYVQGNQFCLAGGEGQSYYDPGDLTWWTNTGGSGPDYPAAVLTYDSRDKTNQALFGWVLGAGMPYLDIATTGTPMLYAGNNSVGPHYFAIQGLRLRSVDPNVGCPNIGHVGRHDGTVFQHCTTERVTYVNQNGNAASRTSGANVSMFSQTGQWSASGNIGMLFGDYIDGLKAENYHSYHVGWKTGANRNATSANGGPGFLCHDIYFHASNGDIAKQRSISIMPANDADNIRCGGSSAVAVAIRAPIGATTGGYSGGQAENPDGSIITRVDDLFIDSSPIDDGSDGEANGGARGWAYYVGSATAGSSVDNALLLNSSQYGVSPNAVISETRQDGNGVAYSFNTAIAMSRITAVGWSSVLDNSPGLANFTLSWTNCATDTLAPGTGNVLQSSLTFSAPKTNLQIYNGVLAKMSIAPGATEDLALQKLVNIIHHRPDLAGDIAQAVVDFTYPCYNKTKTYRSVTLPNLSAETPADIWSGATNDLSAATLSSAAGQSSGAVSVSTNKYAGTLYYVVTTASTPPSVAQVKAGQNASGAAAVAAGSAAVRSPGTKTFTPSGLAAATSYYVHFVHAGGTIRSDSTVATSAQFTTAAPTELLVNGAFNDASAWTLYGGAPSAITGGQYTTGGASRGQIISQPMTYVLGATYRFECDYTFTTGAKLRVEQSTTSGASIPTNGVSGNLTSPGHLSIDFTATVNGAAVFLISADTAGYNGTLDNCSLVRIS